MAYDRRRLRGLVDMAAVNSRVFLTRASDGVVLEVEFARAISEKEKRLLRNCAVHRPDELADVLVQLAGGDRVCVTEHS